MDHLREMLKHFPYPTVHLNQRRAFELIADPWRSLTLELPTGSGKTAVGYSFLKSQATRGEGPLYYITPTKTQVDQIKLLHPDVQIVYGRNEHDCLYFEPEQKFKADEIPCLMLTDCPHRVDQETGLTLVGGVKKCSYYDQTYQAREGKIIVCTFAFYLFTQLFGHWPKPKALVIDEAHRIAQVVRNSLSYEITDHHLWRLVDLLESIGAEEAVHIKSFARKMVRIIKHKPAYKKNVLDPKEIEDLIETLRPLDSDKLHKKVAAEIRKRIDPIEQREALRKLEVLVYDLRRYLDSLAYSLGGADRNPLNYVYSYFEEEESETKKVRYRLFIKAYYVVPLIKKILAPHTLAYSATIGDAQVFGFENGIKSPFVALSSDFPAENTRVFLPTDTPDLSVKKRRRGDLGRVLARIAEACKKFNRAGIRCLVVAVSEVERQKFLELCEEYGVDAMSYGNGVKPKDAALKFRDGEGDVLVGTVANYGEGVDLPKQTAPVIFFLRPGYPSPEDPGTIFEERRFGGMKWRVWNWRVMLEALQVRGRNIRSSEDLGVCFFISQQFRRFLRPALPKWLGSSYRGQQKFDESVAEALKLLKKKAA